MKPVLRIDFCDLWRGLDKADNFFTRSLAARFEVRVSDFPDVLIYGDQGQHHRLHTCRKVFFTTESIHPDFTECDYGMTPFYSDDPRRLRVPYYTMLGDPARLVREPGEAERIAAEPREFCAFVVSQDHGKKTEHRLDFFRRLSRYKKVSSGGRMLNNIGGPLGPTREDKLAFLRRHKFMIAFENGAHPGYLTEKLYDAMEARCIPIYWGDPEVARDFNPKSFINAAAYKTPDVAIQRVVEVDNDPALYRSMLEEPFFHGNRPNEAFSAERICDFFERIAADTSVPLASRRKAWFRNRWTLAKRDRPWHPFSGR